MVLLGRLGGATNFRGGEEFSKNVTFFLDFPVFFLDAKPRFWFNKGVWRGVYRYIRRKE